MRQKCFTALTQGQFIYLFLKALLMNDLPDQIIKKGFHRNHYFSKGEFWDHLWKTFSTFSFSANTNFYLKEKIWQFSQKFYCQLHFISFDITIIFFLNHCHKSHVVFYLCVMSVFVDIISNPSKFIWNSSTGKDHIWKFSIYEGRVVLMDNFPLREAY